MRASRADKEKSRARIVTSAARLLREQGIEGANVADVMKDAGLTHGGFYRHFDGKEALLAAALDQAFSDMFGHLNSGLETTSAEAAVEAFKQSYLSDAHVENPGFGCPVAAVAAEVARADGLKAGFGAGVSRIIEALAQGESGTKRQRRESAARRLAMMAGAVMIARASDPATSQMVLGASRKKARQGE